jgi:uncharacterized membrane protein
MPFPFLVSFQPAYLIIYRHKKLFYVHRNKYRILAFLEFIIIIIIITYAPTVHCLALAALSVSLSYTQSE